MNYKVLFLVIILFFPFESYSFHVVANTVDNLIPFYGMNKIVLQKEKSFAEQLTQSNCIYVIRHDFDLNDPEGKNPITLPTGCLLEFDGGSLKNGVIIGNNASFNNVKYRIFDNCIPKGFNIECINPIWFGAIPDYNEQTHKGTDNALTFQKVFDIIDRYYNGLSVEITGRFYIGRTITIKSSLCIFGYHNNSRNFKGASYGSTSSTPSGLFIKNDIVAFDVVGFDAGNYSFCNIYLRNLKISNVERKIKNNTFVKLTASGGPSRVAVVREVEFCYMGKVFYVHANRDTALSDLSIDGCVAYGNEKFILAETDNVNYRTLSNLVIENSNIEQNGEKAIEIHSPFAGIIIRNNCLEDQICPIYIEDGKNAKIEIKYNSYEYFGKEVTAEFAVIKGKRGTLDTHVDFSNNRFNNKVTITTDRLIIDNLDFSILSDESELASSVIRCNPIGFYPKYVGEDSWVYIQYPVSSGNGNYLEKHTSNEQGYLGYIGTNWEDYYNFGNVKDDDVRYLAAYVTINDGQALAIGINNGKQRTTEFYVSQPNTQGLIISKVKLLKNNSVNKLQLRNRNGLLSGVQLLDAKTPFESIKVPTTTIVVTDIEKTPVATSSNNDTYFDTVLGKLIHWNGSKWVEEDGASRGVNRKGTYNQKPLSKDIYIGFRYFCTDRKTPEGKKDGIDIIYKGNNEWVDALGREVF